MRQHDPTEKIFIFICIVSVLHTLLCYSIKKSRPPRIICTGEYLFYDRTFYQVQVFFDIVYFNLNLTDTRFQNSGAIF